MAAAYCRHGTKPARGGWRARVDAMGVLIQHELEYFSGRLDVTFGATLEKDNDAAWGVDDVQLFVL